MLIKEHITILPSPVHTDITSLRTNDLRVDEYIQYGYIKKRDLTRWENNEEIAVKMGMLTPSNYKGKTIIGAALARIEEQDTTSCFEDEDELIPVYVFVAKETDNEWREHLATRGFVNTRTNKSREGMRTNREKLFCEYGMHYGVETKELKSFKEKKQIEDAQKAELARIAQEKRLEEQRKYEEEYRVKREKAKIEGIREYNQVYGENAYENRLAELKHIVGEKERKNKEKDVVFSIEENTLSYEKEEDMTTTNVNYESENTWLFWVILLLNVIFLCMAGEVFRWIWIIGIGFWGLLSILDIIVSTHIDKEHYRGTTKYTFYDGKLRKVREGDKMRYVWIIPRPTRYYTSNPNHERYWQKVREQGRIR